MRTLYLLILLAGTLLPGSALTIIPDPEGEKRQAALVQHNQACISHLQKVTDMKSADAAAKAIATLKKKRPAVDFDYSAERTRIDRLSSDLSKKYFYGSTELATVLGYPVNDALLPSPVTPELISRMEAELRQRSKQQEDISGGTGFTQENAWIVDIDDERKNEKAASATAFDAVGGNVYKSHHRKLLTDTRRYMVFTLEVIRDGQKYVVEQWCDTTAARKLYSPARRDRARNEIKEIARELYATLLSICDEETAEDFGEDVLELCEDIADLDLICEADEQVLNHLYDALEMPERERIASHLRKLRFDLYRVYDEDLKKALDCYLDVPVPH